MTFRNYLLDAALDRVTSSMHLRRPQHEALEEFHRLIGWLPETLGSLSAGELRNKLHECKPTWSIDSVAPHMSFALATGVGKSRLMAALIAYLALANESRNFVILAPRRTVLDKFLRELSSTSQRFLFVDPSLIPEIKVWHSDNIAAFRDESSYEGLYAIDPVNIFVLSQQSLVGDDRRVSRVDEFSGVSVQNWLAEKGDLVVLSDEAHHFGGLSRNEAAAWTEAVRQLAPKMHLLFTATPSSDANELYTYDLATCLQEKIYTKDVRIIAKERPKAADISDDDWDRVTIEFGLRRLAQKRAAIEAQKTNGFPNVQPVMLICCADTTHADGVANWLVSAGHLDADQVLVAHSKRGKSEEDISRLLHVDQVGSKVQVVVTVFQLTEGWDVSNVYVIAPLRAMSTFTGAIQTVGRGLRLPSGQRVDEPELDTLDVLTFGRETLDQILAEATEAFGDKENKESGVKVTDAEDPEFDRPVPSKSITAPLIGPMPFELPRMRVRQTEPDLDFEPDVAKKLADIAAQEFSVVARVVKKSDNAVRLPRTTFVEMTVQRVVSALIYLSMPLHGTAIRVLVERFLDASGADRDAEMIAHDWRVAGDLLSRQIDATYRKTATTTFEATGSKDLALRDQTLYVPVDWSAPLDQQSLSWSPTSVRQPISGWSRCTHSMASFDTRGEFHVATLLDRSEVDWWLRNDPALLRIPTPIGFYGPDFIVKRSHGSETLLLEVKGADLWEAPDSDARIKAAAADAYCAEVSSATSDHWEYWVILDEDAKAANSLEELHDFCVKLTE